MIASINKGCVLEGCPCHLAKIRTAAAEVMSVSELLIVFFQLKFPVASNLIIRRTTEVMFYERIISFHKKSKA